MSRRILAGATDVSVVIRIIDSTDGTPETGVVWNTSGIDLEYRRELAASVDITEATLAALTTAHTDGGFLHIGNGYYRLDLPDAAVATGVTGVLVHGTVTGMVVIGEYIELVAYNPYDAVRLGLTALPNAAADAAGGLPISDAGGLDLDAQRSDVAAILVDTGTTLDGRIPAALVGGRMDSNMGAISADAVAADNAEAFFDGTGYAGTNNVMPNVTTLTTYTGNTPQTGDAFARLGAAGVGLTAVPWNAAWDAEVQSEVDDALIAQRLDELLNADSDIDGLAPPTVGSVIHEMLTKTAGSFTYDQTTDSLEAVRDRGDVAWITAAGFSTHSAADVWSVVTRTLTGLGFTLAASDIGADAIGASELAADAANEIADAILDRTNGIETSYTLRQALRLILSSAAAKLSGAATVTVAIRDVGDTKDRITATVDANGNRTAVTLDAT